MVGNVSHCSFLRHQGNWRNISVVEPIRWHHSKRRWNRWMFWSWTRPIDFSSRPISGKIFNTYCRICRSSDELACSLQPKLPKSRLLFGLDSAIRHRLWCVKKSKLRVPIKMARWDVHLTLLVTSTLRASPMKSWSALWHYCVRTEKISSSCFLTPAHASTTSPNCCLYFWRTTRPFSLYTGRRRSVRRLSKSFVRWRREFWRAPMWWHAVLTSPP